MSYKDATAFAAAWSRSLGGVHAGLLLVNWLSLGRDAHGLALHGLPIGRLRNRDLELLAGAEAVGDSYLHDARGRLDLERHAALHARGHGDCHRLHSFVSVVDVPQDNHDSARRPHDRAEACLTATPAR